MKGETAAASSSSSIDVQESVKTTILTSTASSRITLPHGSWRKLGRVASITTAELE
jgi:hypothetical protein